MKVGDVWRNPQGGGMRMERVEPERLLAMRSEDGSWVWSFVLVEEGGRTRFLSRNRFALKGGRLARLASMLLMEPGSLIMERKMLLGIASRAERLARERRHLSPLSPAEPAPGPAPEDRRQFAGFGARTRISRAS